MPANCTSRAVIDATQQIFSEQGVPEKVISDNGPHYASTAYNAFSEEWGFTHITSSPHFPQSNGFAERIIQTVKRTMTKARASGQNISMALLCLRTTPVDSKLQSPAELLCGRKFQSNLQVVIKHTSEHKDQTYQRLQDRQAQQKAYHDRSAHDLKPLHPGQLVRVQDPNTGLWTPAQIKQCCEEPRSYVIVTPNGRELRRNRRHLRDIEPVKKRVTFEDAAPPSRDSPTRDNSNTPTITRSGRQVRPPKRLDL